VNARRASPPTSEAELLARVSALRGRSLAEIACALDGDARASRIAGAGVRTKGKAGELVERALGATGGSAKVHDFVELGVELKTVPVDLRGRPRESTYVCTLPMDDADRVEWETSWVRAKLARVLWVPLVGEDDASQADRRIGEALLWSPTAEQEAILRADFEEALGAIALGHVEALTARAGRWLQVRPKARDGAARTTAWGPDGEAIATVPRGFYLRAVFTGGILRDAAALP
jgi:DNA mismatch repair protein MutH